MRSSCRLGRVLCKSLSSGRELRKRKRQASRFRAAFAPRTGGTIEQCGQNPMAPRDVRVLGYASDFRKIMAGAAELRASWDLSLLLPIMPGVLRRGFETNARPAFVKSVYSFKTDQIKVPDDFCGSAKDQSKATRGRVALQKRSRKLCAQCFRNAVRRHTAQSALEAHSSVEKDSCALDICTPAQKEIAQFGRVVITTE
jgi:hypothetical protein